LTAPRGMFALAERGDFPAVFGAVHPRWRTPYVSIAVFAVLLWGFSQFASFSWNVTLSAVARIFYYGGLSPPLPVPGRPPRRRAGAAPQAARGGCLPAAGRTAASRDRRRHLRVTPDARRLQQIGDSVRHDRCRAAELGTGAGSGAARCQTHTIGASVRLIGLV